MGVMPFLVKSCRTLSVGRYTRKSPIMKWENAWKVFKTNSLKPLTASHNNASWYTDADGFLEHSPRGGGKPVLQGARPSKDKSGFILDSTLPHSHTSSFLFSEVRS